MYLFTLFIQAPELSFPMFVSINVRSKFGVKAIIKNLLKQKSGDIFLQDTLDNEYHEVTVSPN